LVGNGSGDFVVEGGGATQDVLDSVASGVGRTFGWSGDGPVRRVRRTWLDTFDWRLYRAGLSLEQQAGGSGTELVLTGRDGERLAALPVSNARGGSARGGSARDGSARDGSARGGNDGAGNGRAPSWPSLITALPPSPLRELVEPIVGIRALMPVARAASRIHGQRALNADAKTVARLAVDEMSVSYPARAKAAPRLSVSPVRGYQAQADRISGTLAGAAGIRPSRQSGLEVALAAVGEQPGRRHRDVQLTPAMPAATAMAAILTAQFDAVEANVPGTIRDIDTEFLHDLRVAVRRTRSALKLAGQPLPADLTAAYRPEFRWLGDLTTPTRDLDVYLLGFGDMVAGLVGAEPADLDPFQEYLLRARAAAHRDLTRGLRSARFARLARQWRGDLDGIRPARRRPTVAQLGARRIAAAQRRALRAGLGITGASPAQDLHDLRKDCKELRYLVEMFGSLHDPAQRWQAIRELKALQDCLGEFQDAEVQRAELRAFADRMLAQRSAPAATLLAMGEIAAGLARRQLQARADFDSRFAAFAGQASQARLAALTEVSAA
jgi:CHAD domain-containing protein